MSDAYTCHFLDRDAFRAADDARMHLAKTRIDGVAGASLSEIVKPCAMWHSRWYFDPDEPGHKIRRERALRAIAEGSFSKQSYYLSKFYWSTWSHVRPPISVLCPNGREWCVDAVSSNGDGWQVTGDPPRITAQPSIMVPGYHGFLKGGVFTPNM